MSPASTANSGGQSGHLTEDLLIDLLHNLLSHEERHGALTHMRACASCERMFQRMVSRRERFRSQLAPDAQAAGTTSGEVLEQELDEHAGSWSLIWDSLVAALRPPKIRIAMGLAGVAAVLLLLLIPGRQTADLRWLPTDSKELRFRATEGGIPNEGLLRGLEAYGNHDLTDAIASLRSAKASGQLETIRRIYLGSALAWNGDFEEAVKTLKTVDAGLLPSPWGSETRWTLYLAFSKAERESSADSLLRALAAEEGDVGDRAREELGSN